MGKTLFEEALDGVVEVVNEVSDSFTKEFKGTNPFDKEPVSEEEALRKYNATTTEQFDELVQTHGVDAMSEYVNKMEELNRRMQ